MPSLIFSENKKKIRMPSSRILLSTLMVKVFHIPVEQNVKVFHIPVEQNVKVFHILVEQNVKQNTLSTEFERTVDIIQGPAVQSVISLTSSLRVISLTVLADSIYSYSHFFSKKFQHICISLDVNFNESLTNDVVSFEQVGPD